MSVTDIVVFSLEPWDEIWRRNQYLVDGLLRRDPKMRVLFVEPANDLLHSLVTGRGVRRGNGLRTAPGYDGRLLLFQPDKLLPRIAGRAADALLRASVRRAVRREKLCPSILWINDPGWAGFVQHSAEPALYDVTDDWLKADRPARETQRILANEDILLRRCAQVVVCSADLADSRGARRSVVRIPNAVDVARYRTPYARPTDMPAGPAAVYVGTLHEDRLDVDLLVALAERLHAGGGTVVLVGPNALDERNTRRLLSTPGVALLGGRGWTEVPTYLQHASVLIVPHVVSEFTNSLDPIKFYEYRVVGRPIVSTAVAGFRDLQAPDAVTATHDAFVEAVLDAVQSDWPSRYVTDVPDWSDRVEQFAGVLDEMQG